MKPVSQDKSHCFKHACTYPNSEPRCPYCELARLAPRAPTAPLPECGTLTPWQKNALATMSEAITLLVAGKPKGAELLLSNAFDVLNALAFRSAIQPRDEDERVIRSDAAHAVAAFCSRIRVNWEESNLQGIMTDLLSRAFNWRTSDPVAHVCDPTDENFDDMRTGFLRFTERVLPSGTPLYAVSTIGRGTFIPQEVWDWLMGEGEDFKPSAKQLERSAFAPGAYWWRPELRRRVEAITAASARQPSSE